MKTLVGAGVSWMWFLLGLVVLGLVAYGALVLGAKSLQQQLLYVPDRARTLPQDAGLPGVREVQLKTPDGERVLAWFSPPARPDGKVVLYFHGNGGTLITRAERIAKYLAEGHGMFMMTYRGYGGSSGLPSERANVRDAIQAYDWLRAEGVPPQQIVLYGESLGTGVAIQVAGTRSVAGLILDAPYTSMVDLAELHFPVLPSRWLMIDRYESIRHIAHVSAPLFVVHGEDDRVIPLAMGREIFEAAREPKQLKTFAGAGHSDHGLFGSYDAIFAFLKTLPHAPAS